MMFHLVTIKVSALTSSVVARIFAELSISDRLVVNFG